MIGFGVFETSLRAPDPVSILMLMRDTASTSKPCPICGKPAEQPFRPFCSRRCADVDLHRWLSGAYAVPVIETDDLPDQTDKEPS
jgi:endogenous inhibitor of DNA gyrase (YacG/DUF329 family)